MAKQTFTTGQVLTAAQVNSLQANDFNQTVSVKTADYTLVAADKGTRIEFNTSGSVTCTVNTGIFDAGDTLIIQNRGAGAVTVTAGTATVDTSATLVLSQYDSGTLYFVSASSSIFFNSDAGGATPLTTKGDLYTFSTSDTRLAVGDDGSTILADSSQSTGLRYNPQNALANPVINGGYDIWQRGTSFANPANGYTADRWLGASNAGLTVSRQTVSDTTNLPNIQYAIRIQRNSGSTTTSELAISQSFESVNTYPFVGKTVTLSFYARAGANFSSASSNMSARINTGTGTDQNIWTAGYTGSAQPVAGTSTLTTTWQRFAYTGTIASTATEMGIIFGMTPVGTAGAADYFEVTGVQIDLGTYTASTAPTFRRSGGTLQGELAACQRYYYAHPIGVNKPITNSAAYSATNALGIIPFRVTMRTAPTLSVVSGTNYYQIVANGGVDNLNSFSQDSSSTDSSTIFNNTEVAQTAGHAGIFISNNASAGIAWSAEL